MKTLRLLVCGGRDFTDREAVDAVLDATRARYRIETVIAGGARGADSLAADWARRQWVPLLVFPVTAEEWAFHGKRAGHLRNFKMLDQGRPNAVIAFPGGPGTADMIRQAEERDIPIWQPLRPRAT